MMAKQGDYGAVDSLRAEILRHPQIKIEDTPQFYDMEVFNLSLIHISEPTRH